MNSFCPATDVGQGAALAVLYREVASLRPRTTKARTHSKHQIRQIAQSIEAFGFTNPVLLGKDRCVIAGHGRLEAAKLLGMTEVPTIRLESLTEQQIRAYVIADNKLAENAGWNEEILAIELEYLLTLEDANFDVTITGFEVPEIDMILEEAKALPDPEDGIPDVPADQPLITQTGDLWLLGKHRIIAGNALQKASYETLLGTRRADAVFTDPPYNVRIDGHATGNGAIRHREFAMASGEMSETEFISFLSNGLRRMADFSNAGSVHYICMDWRHIGDLIRVGLEHFDEFVNLCVWVKDNGGMGSFYRSQHELVAVFSKGKGRRNNVQLGQYGRYRTNVWHYPGVHTLSKQGEEGNLLALHPTVKPISMAADAILDCTARGEIVLDPFLGSGTTLLAAERVGRACCGIEMDPIYVDLAIRRWQKLTGEAAVHASSGKRFEEIAPTQEVVRG